MIRFNQLYFPGWKIKINGLYIADQLLKKYLTPSGLMIIPLGKGSYNIEAWYDGPPGFLWRNILIGSALLSYLIFAFYEKHKNYNKN